MHSPTEACPLCPWGLPVLGSLRPASLEARTQMLPQRTPAEGQTSSTELPRGSERQAVGTWQGRPPWEGGWGRERPGNASQHSAGWARGGEAGVTEGSLCARDPVEVALLTLPVTPRGGSRGISSAAGRPVGLQTARSCGGTQTGPRRGLTAITRRCGPHRAPTPPGTRRCPPALSSLITPIVQKVSGRRCPPCRVQAPLPPAARVCFPLSRG